MAKRDLRVLREQTVLARIERYRRGHRRQEQSAGQPRGTGAARAARGTQEAPR